MESNLSYEKNEQNQNILSAISTNIRKSKDRWAPFCCKNYIFCTKSSIWLWKVVCVCVPCLQLKCTENGGKVKRHKMKIKHTQNKENTHKTTTKTMMTKEPNSKEEKHTSKGNENGMEKWEKEDEKTVIVFMNKWKGERDRDRERKKYF